VTRRIIALVGPTASGKTTLAIELAQQLDGEIVSADSRQVYRRMDVGTAKPTPAEQAAARHHLIDIVNPDEPFSLGRWLELAKQALEDIWSRGKQPLLVGGTGQYVWALLEGWRVPQVPPQDEFRIQMEGRSPEALVEELREIDPGSSALIDPRNVRRVIRALEVSEVTGKPFSYWRAKQPPTFESVVVGLRLLRNDLYRRIDERVERMMDAEFLGEVRSLLDTGYSREMPSMSGIGYKEIADHLAGETDLETAVTQTKTGTHRLARHQNSWFKAADRRIRWVDIGGGTIDVSSRLVAEFLSNRNRVQV